MVFLRYVSSFLTSAFLFCNLGFLCSAQVSVTVLPQTYAQDFGTSSIASWTNNSTFLGWYNDGGTWRGDINITAASPANDGGLYAYRCNGTNDRKIGFRPSNGSGGGPCTNQNCGHAIAFRAQNNAGENITSVRVEFDMFQLSNVQDGSNINTVFFDYRTGMNLTTVPLGTGGWTNVPALQYTGSTAGAGCGGSQLSGLPCTQSSHLTACIEVLVSPGQEIQLRWTDSNDPCNDPHFAIDNVVVTFYPDCTSPVLDAIADTTACNSFIFPNISGLNLSGDQAYYTGPSGTGTKYEEGAELNMPGNYTIYAHDSSGAKICNTMICEDDEIFTLNISTPIVPEFDPIDDICQGTVPPALPAVSNNGIAGTWNPAVINTSATGTFSFTFTPDPIPGQCAKDTIIDVTITDAINPLFNSVADLCQGTIPPTLPFVSNNTINGTWNPAVINTATTGTFSFTFTPDPGQCATDTTIDVTITDAVIPLFDPISDLCQGTVPPTLPLVSNNVINGTWNPTTINTSATETFSFTFTPDPGQCATDTTIDVTITDAITPLFDPVEDLCQGITPPALPDLSNNGITGAWNPADINTSVAGTFSFTFTPDPGQCANDTTIDAIIVDNTVIPIFDPIDDLCQGTVPPDLPLISNNGVSGTWNPSSITTLASGNLTFTFIPNPGQCASESILNLNITKKPQANFDYSPEDLTVENTHVVFANTSENANTYLWHFSGLGTSTDENPTFTFPEVEGEYLVQLIASSDNGCSDSTAVFLQIQEDLIFYVPNAFSPNGDGTNDIFLPIMTAGFNPQEFQLLIFNRWGEVIFESQNPWIGWDGSYRGSIVADDVYLWKIFVSRPNLTARKEFYGHVTILK